nr:hypothetical protein [uncultured Pseudodesulfovibrio sp.]
MKLTKRASEKLPTHSIGSDKVNASSPTRHKRKIGPDDLMACAIFLSFVYLFVERLVGLVATKYVHPEGVLKFFFDPKKVVFGAADPLPLAMAYCLIFALVFSWIDDTNDGFNTLINKAPLFLNKYINNWISFSVIVFIAAMFLFGMVFTPFRLEVSAVGTLLGAFIFLFYVYYHSDGLVIRFSVMFALLYIIASMAMAFVIMYNKDNPRDHVTWMRGANWFVPDIWVYRADGRIVAGDFVFLTDTEVAVRVGRKEVIVPRSNVLQYDLNKFSGMRHEVAH